jgi:peptide/nickel transport system permease protein
MKLLRYILKRLIHLIPVLFGVSIIIFSVSHVLPGDPAYLFVRPVEQSHGEVERMRKHLGLDRPLHEQYLTWLRNVLRGDLGDSWFSGQTVAEGLKRRFPATLELTTLAMLISISISIPLGVLAAAYKDSWIDYLSRPVAVLGVSVPSFWLGLILIYFLFFKFHIFPAPIGRIGSRVSPPTHITGLYLVDSMLTRNWVAFKSSLAHLALPAMTLAFVTQSSINRITRSAMLEILQSDFIWAARANGVPERQIYFRDALRNALLAPLTTIGMIYRNLLGGMVVIEQIFSWPGIGRYAIKSIEVNDYNPVQGFVVLTALLTVIVFLLIDLLYFAIDPRIRE